MDHGLGPVFDLDPTDQEAATLLGYSDLLHKLAWAAEKRLPPHSLDHDDLVQEGRLVALLAIRHYKPKGPVEAGPYVPGVKRGAKLMTYITVSVLNRYKRLVRREIHRTTRVTLPDEPIG